MTYGSPWLIMTMTETKRVFPAEWEEESGVLLSWPHEETDWAEMLPRVTDCYVRLATALCEKGIKLLIISPDSTAPRAALAALPQERIIYVDVATNDTWTRDFGPITVREGEAWKVCDFKFNGWGLKFAACFDNLVTSYLCDRRVIGGAYENHLGFVLEGGSIESDGKGTVLTTSRCMLSPNRNGDLTRGQIEARLRESLGAQHILWVEHGALAGDDTDSHIDTLARLAPHNTIIYAGCQDPEDEHYTELMKMKEELAELRTPEGTPYNLYELPMPDAVYSADGQRLPATYANYLVTPRAVFMPTYGNPLKDMTAAGILGAVFEKEVVSIDCLALIEQHGSLHCATMQIPESILI